jgi:hypothetical protein
MPAGAWDVERTGAVLRTAPAGGAHGVPVLQALAGGIGAGAAAGIINILVLVLSHSNLPPVTATGGSCLVAGALGGLAYALWSRVTPYPAAALWVTALVIAAIDTIVLFTLPFPTAARHVHMPALAGLVTPALQILAVFGAGGFSRMHMPASLHNIYIAVHFVTAIVVSLLVPAFVRRRVF